MFGFRCRMVHTTMEGRKKGSDAFAVQEKNSCGVMQSESTVGPSRGGKLVLSSGRWEKCRTSFFKDEMIQILENQRAQVSRCNRKQAHRKTLFQKMFQKEFSSLTKKKEKVPPTHLFCSTSSLPQVSLYSSLHSFPQHAEGHTDFCFGATFADLLLLN